MSTGLVISPVVPPSAPKPYHGSLPFRDQPILASTISADSTFAGKSE